MNRESVNKNEPDCMFYFSGKLTIKVYLYFICVNSVKNCYTTEYLSKCFTITTSKN